MSGVSNGGREPSAAEWLENFIESLRFAESYKGERADALAAVQALRDERDEFQRMLGECTCADPLCSSHGDDLATVGGELHGV